MKQEQAGIGQWAILYAKILEIARLRPWQQPWADKPVSICLPGRRDVVYARFTEEGPLQYIDFCLGDTALLDYEALRGAEPAQAAELTYLQRCLSARLGPAEDLSGEDLELIARMAPSFPWESPPLRFRSYEPGYVPSFPSRRETALFIDLAEQLCEALKDAAAGLVCPEEALGEALCRRFDEVSGAWRTEAAVPQPVRKEPAPLVMADELLPRRALQRPIVDAKLELDCFYLPRAVEDEGFHKPYYPRVLALADSRSGLIAAYESMTPAETVSEKFQALIGAFLETYGRPLILYMSDPALCALLGDYLDGLFFPWRQVAFLPAMDSFKLTRGISHLSDGAE